MTRQGAFVAAALAVGSPSLTGCAGARRIDVAPTFGYSESIARQATGGLQQVEIAGTPPDGADAETVAAALRGPAGYPPTRYAADAGAPRGVRTVLEFGAPRPSATVCSAPRGGGAGDGGLVVSASVCRGDTAVSTATLTAPDVAGPSSPGFADAMSSLLDSLLPTEGRRRDGAGARGGA